MQHKIEIQNVRHVKEIRHSVEIQKLGGTERKSWLTELIE
jgi:hypothetical protein